MTNAPANAITILDREFLLVETGGSQIHLAGEEAEHVGRAATPADRLRPDYPGYIDSAASYDTAALLTRRWSSSTLCGRTWSNMAAGEPGPIHQHDRPGLVPTCRSCLRIIDRRFPAAKPADGVEIVASLIAEQVVTFGSVMVLNVPADQLEATRRAARRHIRQKGFGSNTYVVSDVLHVLSDDAYDAIDEDTKRKWSVALANAITPEGATPLPPDMKPTPINWRTWATG